MGYKERMAWDERKDFPKWWEINKDLNPGIDPKKISIAATKPILREHTAWGINEIKPILLFSRKNIFKSRNRKIGYARDYDEFMKYFIPKLNPHINLETLRITDENTDFTYISREGGLKTIKVKSFYNNFRNNNNIFVEKKQRNKTRHKKLVTEYPQFNDFYKKNKEYNTDVDVGSLLASENIELNYIDETGCSSKISLKEIIHNKSSSGKIRKKEVLLINDKEFCKFFEKEAYLNPNIDIGSITAHETDVLIRYLSFDNTVKTISVNSLFKKSRPRKFHYPFYSIQRYETEDFTDHHLRERLDGSGKNISCSCSSGHNFKIKPRDYVRNQGNVDKFCPICNEKNETKTINELDKEVALFWDDDPKLLDTINPASQNSYNFHCPYCGFIFPRRMINIVLRSPKCPQCGDTGYINNNDNDLPADLFFGSRYT